MNINNRFVTNKQTLGMSAIVLGSFITIGMTAGNANASTEDTTTQATTLQSPSTIMHDDIFCYPLEFNDNINLTGVQSQQLGEQAQSSFSPRTSHSTYYNQNQGYSYETDRIKGKNGQDDVVFTVTHGPKIEEMEQSDITPVPELPPITPVPELPKMQTVPLIHHETNDGTRTVEYDKSVVDQGLNYSYSSHLYSSNTKTSNSTYSYSKQSYSYSSYYFVPQSNNEEGSVLDIDNLDSTLSYADIPHDKIMPARNLVVEGFNRLKKNKRVGWFRWIRR